MAGVISSSREPHHGVLLLEFVHRPVVVADPVVGQLQRAGHVFLVGFQAGVGAVVGEVAQPGLGLRGGQGHDDPVLRHVHALTRTDDGVRHRQLPGGEPTGPATTRSGGVRDQLRI